ncbi:MULTISPECIES: hypothetical protein [Vibrio]|uniref:hypothetical protein n=1 Tax=Vibrio TaxID=662 RepID=UPI00159EEEF9|nr:MULTISPECIES: hypothetical protein [Vibrio]
MNRSDLRAATLCKAGFHRDLECANFCSACGKQLNQHAHKAYLVLLRDGRRLLTTAVSKKHAFRNVTTGDPDFTSQEPLIASCEVKKVIEVKSTRYSDLALKY